jgi:RNA polymerase sigma-32 factor
MKTSSHALSRDQAAAIARELGVKPEEVVEMETRLSGHDIALDPTPADDEEHAYAPIAWLTASSDDEPAQILERKQAEQGRSEGLKRALAKLDARSRRIIEARWLKETDPATLQELADEYGVSAERIRQIESKALKQMRGAFPLAA